MLKLSSLAVFILAFASLSTAFSSSMNPHQVLVESSLEDTHSSDLFDTISATGFDASSCQYIFDEENKWDFSGMKKYKYTGKDPAKPNETFSIDFCGSSHHYSCVSEYHRSACRYVDDEVATSLGSFSKTPLPVLAPISPEKPEAGISFSFYNGDRCGSTQTLFTFRVYCDMEAVEPVFTVSMPQKCSYSAMLYSKFGCPGYSESDDSSLGWIIAIVLLSVLALSIGFAVYVKRGDVSYWTIFIGFLKTGVMASFVFLKSLCGSKSNSSNDAYGTFEE